MEINLTLQDRHQQHHQMDQTCLKIISIVDKVIKNLHEISRNMNTMGTFSSINEIQRASDIYYACINELSEKMNFLFEENLVKAIYGIFNMSRQLILILLKSYISLFHSLPYRKLSKEAAEIKCMENHAIIKNFSKNNRAYENTLNIENNIDQEYDDDYMRRRSSELYDKSYIDQHDTNNNNNEKSKSPSKIVDKQLLMLSNMVNEYKNSNTLMNEMLYKRPILFDIKTSEIEDYLMEIKHSLGEMRMINEERDYEKDMLIASLTSNEATKIMLNRIMKNQMEIGTKTLYIHNKKKKEKQVDKATAPDIKIFDINKMINENANYNDFKTKAQKLIHEKDNIIEDQDTKLEQLKREIEIYQWKNFNLEHSLQETLNKYEVTKKQYYQALEQISKSNEDRNFLTQQNSILNDKLAKITDKINTINEKKRELEGELDKQKALFTFLKSSNLKEMNTTKNIEIKPSEPHVVSPQQIKNIEFSLDKNDKTKANLEEIERRVIDLETKLSNFSDKTKQIEEKNLKSPVNDILSSETLQKTSLIENQNHNDFSNNEVLTSREHEIQTETNKAVNLAKIDKLTEIIEEIIDQNAKEVNFSGDKNTLASQENQKKIEIFNSKSNKKIDDQKRTNRDEQLPKSHNQRRKIHKSMSSIPSILPILEENSKYNQVIHTNQLKRRPSYTLSIKEVKKKHEDIERKEIQPIKTKDQVMNKEAINGNIEKNQSKDFNNPKQFIEEETQILNPNPTPETTNYLQANSIAGIDDDDNNELIDDSHTNIPINGDCILDVKGNQQSMNSDDKLVKRDSNILSKRPSKEDNVHAEQINFPEKLNIDKNGSKIKAKDIINDMNHEFNSMVDESDLKNSRKQSINSTIFKNTFIAQKINEEENRQTARLNNEQSLNLRIHNRRKSSYQTSQNENYQDFEQRSSNMNSTTLSSINKNIVNLQNKIDENKRKSDSVLRTRTSKQDSFSIINESISLMYKNQSRFKLKLNPIDDSNKFTSLPNNNINFEVQNINCESQTDRTSRRNSIVEIQKNIDNSHHVIHSERKLSTNLSLYNYLIQEISRKNGSVRIMKEFLELIDFENLGSSIIKLEKINIDTFKESLRLYNDFYSFWKNLKILHKICGKTCPHFMKFYQNIGFIIANKTKS